MNTATLSLNVNHLIIFIIMLIISMYFLSTNLMDFNNWMIIQNALSLGLLSISLFLIGYFFGSKELQI